MLTVNIKPIGVGDTIVQHWMELRITTNEEKWALVVWGPPLRVGSISISQDLALLEPSRFALIFIVKCYSKLQHVICTFFNCLYWYWFSIVFLLILFWKYNIINKSPKATQIVTAARNRFCMLKKHVLITATVS